MPRTDQRPDFSKPWRDKGYRLIAGVDEAGRGPLAGPVVAAAVILPLQAHLPGVDVPPLVPGLRLCQAKAVLRGSGAPSREGIDPERSLIRKIPP